MGFKVRTYRLVFEPPGLEGLEVRMRGLSIEQLIRLGWVLQSDKLTDPQDGSVRTEMFQILAAGLIGWNLEDENDVPVPTDAASIQAQPLDLVMQVVLAWKQAVVDVSPPLAPSSNGGELSPEASLPMEVLSPSL